MAVTALAITRCKGTRSLRALAVAAAPRVSAACVGLATRSVATATAAATLKFCVDPGVVERARVQGPLALFETLVQDGQLREDAEQRRVLEYLNAVFHGTQQGTARGLYLYGGVGCGKTMAMDLFFSALRGAAGLRVHRKHFHDFLHDVQVQLHQFRRSAGSVEQGHPVERVGKSIASATDVLCFDEFAVTTIQDCVLLMPLFSILFEHGVTVVATSNRAPEDLYSDGLNRHLYLPPFLDILHRHCKVHHLMSHLDYRVVQHANSSDAGVFCWPHDRCFVDSWYKAATGQTSGSHGCVAVSFGRSVDVPQLSPCGRVARFSFEDLCRRHLSADDYLALCRRFHTILLDDVPCLSVDDHNEARRFTTFIDSCYEQHVRLICSMAGPPEELLGGLSELRKMSLSTLGGSAAGCGDGDTSPSSSGVLQAIDRIKRSLADRQQERKTAVDDGSQTEVYGTAATAFEHMSASEVLSAEVARAHAHGNADMDVWKQEGESGAALPGTLSAPPQVSKAWDDRRRISAFTWESMDPTSEQQSIKGVFAAAVASLKESGFAVERAISRLQEMQTDTFQENHRLKHLQC